MSKQRAEELFTFCQKFIQDQDIGSSEKIYQSDKVIESAYEFIEGVCNIVGYVEHESGDDEL